MACAQISGHERPEDRFKIVFPENYDRFPSHFSLATVNLDQILTNSLPTPNRTLRKSETRDPTCTRYTGRGERESARERMRYEERARSREREKESATERVRVRERDTTQERARSRERDRERESAREREESIVR